MTICKAGRIARIASLFVFLLHTQAACAQMIRGLDRYPVISPQQAEQLGKPQGSITLMLGNHPLPYDAASNTYFIPQERAADGFDGTVSIDEQDGFSYSIIRRDDFTKQTALDYSVGLTVVGINGDLCVSSKIVFTPLPIICVDTDTGNMPGDLAEGGSIQVYTAQAGEIFCEESPIEINLRGNTSKWLPKQSYRVKIVDERGNKENMSLCGLRSDDDWILNPMYSDTSKVREALAYRLWDQINSVGDFAKSSRIEYAEVFLRGQYWGLYGVQERIDRKQVDANKHTGILYKVFANDRPTDEQLLACMETERCGGFEIKHRGEYVTDVWRPAAAYMSFLDGDDDVTGAGLSLRNVIDYGLWAMLVQAHDCHFKNQFLNCVYTGNGYIMYKIPWDLNNTFGDVWLLDSKGENYTGYRLGSLVMDGAFGKLVKSEDPEIYRAIIRRYRQLRENGIDVESITAAARAIHEPIYAAIVRDGKRWPECGMGDGNADNIRDIETSLHDILYRMDKWIEALENTL